MKPGAAANSAINEVADRTDAAAEHYRRFAHALLAHLDATAADG